MKIETLTYNISGFLTSKYHGESSKLCRILFQLAKKAAPSLVFLDEMDDLFGSRSDDQGGNMVQMRSILLAELQKAKRTNGVYFSGATNRIGKFLALSVIIFHYTIHKMKKALYFVMAMF